MKKSRYTEEQIIGILKQHEAGVKTADLCREHGISAATFYGWKSKYGGMDMSNAQQLRQMENENRWHSIHFLLRCFTLCLSRNSIKTLSSYRITPFFPY